MSVVVVLVAKLCLTLAIPWTVDHQAPLSMGFPGQKYWSGLPFPSPRDLPQPGIKPKSPVLQADSLPLSHHGSFYCLSTVNLRRVHETECVEELSQCLTPVGS